MLQKAVREARMEWLVVKLRGAYPNGETGFRGISGYTLVAIACNMLLLEEIRTTSGFWRWLIRLRHSQYIQICRTEYLYVGPSEELLASLTTHGMCWHNDHHEGRRIIPKPGSFC